MELNRDYGKHLARLQGDELRQELRDLIGVIADSDPRTADRGSYLVMENIVRLTMSEQEDFVRQVREANPHASRGVRQKFDEWEKEQANDIAVCLLAQLPLIESQELQEQTIREVLSTNPALNDKARSVLRSWRATQPLQPETVDVILNNSSVWFNDLIAMLPDPLDILEVCVRYSIRTKLSWVMLLSDALEAVEEMSPEQLPFALHFVHELTVADQTLPQDLRQSFVGILAYISEKKGMQGFHQRLERQHGQRIHPTLPDAKPMDSKAAEELVRTNVLYMRTHRGSTAGNYRMLWEAATLAVDHQLKNWYGRIWDEIWHNELLDLGALFAVATADSDRQLSVLTKARQNDRWKKDDRAYDALIVLLRVVQVDDDDFVSSVYATKRPHVLRLYAA